MERRTEKVRVRLTPEELAYLKRRAGSFRFRNGKENFSAYLRELLLTESGYKKDSREISQRLSDLRYELRKIGTNINQIAFKLNANLWTTSDIKDLKEYMQRIEETMARFSKEVEETVAEKWQSQN